MTDVEGNGIASALRSSIGPVRIEGLTRMSGGASRQTWAFDAISQDGTRHELVLRRDPPGRPGEPGAMHREAAAITAAATAGLPVPELLLVTEDPDAFGTAGMVMRRIAGQTIARRILRDAEFGQARRVLVAELGQFAAGLHALAPPAGLPVPDPLAGLRDQLGTFARAPVSQRSAVFERAVAWLEASPPPARRPVLVHGDLRLGNLVVGPRGLAAVLDWELAHAGNPAEDLGWLCVKAWRFGGAGPVAGLGRREELLTAYRSAGGADIGPDELHWWEVLGTLRWGVICLSQAWAHLSGAYRSVELAAIGRRVCEQEWDLLLLLDPEAAVRAAARRPRPAGAAAAEPAPYGRPTASELLAAVQEFLTDQVMAATSGQLAFHARVAANVVGIVARELELGPLPGQAAADGEAGADSQAVADAVAARLAVANPRYFDAA
jgi:aminoglycoside phosphotransferase (APT) family kinase protein